MGAVGSGGMAATASIAAGSRQQLAAVTQRHQWAAERERERERERESERERERERERRACAHGRVFGRSFSPLSTAKMIRD